MVRLYYNSSTKERVKPWDLARGWTSCDERKPPTWATRGEAWIFPSRVALTVFVHGRFAVTRHRDPARGGRSGGRAPPAGRTEGACSGSHVDTFEPEPARSPERDPFPFLFDWADFKFLIHCLVYKLFLSPAKNSNVLVILQAPEHGGVAHKHTAMANFCKGRRTSLTCTTAKPVQLL